VAQRGAEIMARNSGGSAIGERTSRDEVAPWERMQLGSEDNAGANADAAVVVRHKRASRILSGSLFSRGS
jgi:hypothetical protein